MANRVMILQILKSMFLLIKNQGFQYSLDKLLLTPPTLILIKFYLLKSNLNLISLPIIIGHLPRHSLDHYIYLNSQPPSKHIFICSLLLLLIQHNRLLLDPNLTKFPFLHLVLFLYHD